MSISIIIRCLNEEKHIVTLLEGIQQQNIKDYEVILVDSGSTDRTIEKALQFSVKIVHIKPEDFSFGYALNKGCEIATGEILLFASAHVYPVYDDWLLQITSPFQNPKVGLVYGKQIGGPSTKFSEHQLFKRWFPEESIPNQHYPFCNNANCAIRKSLWLSRKYDESLTGLEDLAWAKELLLDQGYVYYNAHAEIVHIHEETPSKIRNRYRREAIALKRIMPNEKFSIFDFLAMSASNIFSDYWHALRQGKIIKNLYDIPMFRINQFWGTYKGYKQVGTISQQLRKRFYYPNGVRTSKKENISRHRIKYN